MRPTHKCAAFSSFRKRANYAYAASTIISTFKISRAKDVLALATENYSQNLPPITTAAGNLHIINSSHIVNGTLNINETIQLAERAAEQLKLLPSQTRAAAQRQPAPV